MVYAQPSFCPRKWNSQTPLGFWHTNGSPNLGQTTRSCYNQQKKKRTCKIVDFAVPTDLRVKMKESEKKDKYLDLARELKKKPRNMKVTIAIGALGRVTKGLVQEVEDLEIRGRVENIQTTALLRSTRILRRVLETRGDLPNSNSSERLSDNAHVKNVPADHSVKFKECEKRDKYLNLARELKKLWNMKVTIIPIVIGALGTVTKGLVQGQRTCK